MSLFALLMEHLLMINIEMLPGDPKRLQKIKSEVSNLVQKLMGKYEAELYQDRYLPEYQKAMREISRREKEAEEDRRQREQAALDRVAEFSADEDAP